MNRDMAEQMAAGTKAANSAADDSAVRGGTAPPPEIALLTGADDRSYALGLTNALVARGIRIDFIGSDQVDGPELHGTPLVTFLNLRGDQSTSASPLRKLSRILHYYARLIVYAAKGRPRLFHILWNNKFEHFDRTLLMLWYRLMGRRVVMTAHNVNAAKRDGRDGVWNRFTLSIQYRLCDHLFVHTQKMRDELRGDFGVPDDRISVIPFGINNTSPTTALTCEQAREGLGLPPDARVLLFFGQIAPYKGLEHLVAALPELLREDSSLRLVIAGKVKKGCESYWSGLEAQLAAPEMAGRVTRRIEHIPDKDVECFFKAADVLVIPYNQIFQSGVPFLAYSFGLPVVATDVGSLREDIVEGRTGHVCPPRDPSALAAAIRAFFTGEVYRSLPEGRTAIREYANDRYSWTRVGAITETAYRQAVSHR